MVKDRYWTMWGISASGAVLWRWEGSTGHYPAIADVDDDGRDEVFVGFALIDHDGRPLFAREAGEAHQDAAYIARLPLPSSTNRLPVRSTGPSGWPCWRPS